MTLFSRRSFALSLLSLCLLVGTSALPVHAAPTFNSGSTGADGPFAPTTDTTLQIPDSGVFNFTTVNIPSGVTVTFTRNVANTPVIILASGDVTIGGVIDVSGGNGGTNITTTGQYSIDGTDRTTGGISGPGGFDGGGGGGITAPFNGVAGGGPGGGGGGQGSFNGGHRGSGGSAGYASAGADGIELANGGDKGIGGVTYGDLTIAQLLGGSGGGGGGSANTTASGSGGGGGGAILIASSGTLNLNGNLYSRGGNGGSSDYANNSGDGGGGGSGGAIRLIATTLTGRATFNVLGGSGYFYSFNASGQGGYGYIRLEAINFNSFSPTLAGGQGSISTGTTGVITPINPPQLQIVSVAGISAPASPRGSLQGPPDIIVKNTVTNPVDVAIVARNIPLATIVTLSLIPQTGTETSVPSNALAGTSASSTTTASVSLPDGKCVLYASATVDLTGTKMTMRMKMDGEFVDKILVAAVYGGPSQLTYVLHSGRKIVIGKLPLGVQNAQAGRN